LRTASWPKSDPAMISSNLREEPVDLVDELLRALLLALELLARAHLQQVVRFSSIIFLISSSVSPEVAVTVIDCLRPSRGPWPTPTRCRPRDLEVDLDLHLAARRLAQARQDELAEQLVLLARSLSPWSTRIFTDVLVVADRGEDVPLRARHRGVLLDELVEVAAHDHDAEGVRRHVEQQHVRLLIDERHALDGGPERDHLVGWTPLLGSRPKNSCTISCTFGMRVWPPTRMTSSISFLSMSASNQRALAEVDGPLDEIDGELLELGARERPLQVERLVAAGGE